MLMTAQHCEVSRLGELVILEMGNIARSMEFQVALQLSARMMMAGRVAKRAAGDDGRRYRMAGSMTDANAPKEVISRFAHIPERISAADAYPHGTLVAVLWGGAVTEMPYNAAFQLAQWLRIHGKEARNKAGERAHWTAIANAKEAEARVQ